MSGKPFITLPRGWLPFLLLAAACLAQDSAPPRLPPAFERATRDALAKLRALQGRQDRVGSGRKRRTARIRAALEPWYTQLARLEPDRRLAPLLADRSLLVLHEWLACEAAPRVRAQLARRFPRMAFLLRRATDPERRRGFLAAIADQEARDAGRSDLDALCETVAWEALFLAGVPGGRRGLDALSRDLVLLFTERGPGGLALSKSPHYRHGRFKDGGFRPSLRDGGDQVRHFCWALRMFAGSNAPGLTEKVLRMKEERDARTRGQPLNEADLRLNRAARRLAHRLAPPPPGTHPGATSRPAPRPPAPSAWPALLRSTLGEKPPRNGSRRRP